MKANEFVKKYGLELSREIVSKQPKWASNVRVSEIIGTWEYTEKVLPSFSIVELKRLVESHELVEYMGGIDKAKEQAYVLAMEVGGFNPAKVEKAITDVEACKGVL